MDKDKVCVDDASDAAALREGVAEPVPELVPEVVPELATLAESVMLITSALC